jgi:hypothetical protein
LKKNETTNFVRKPLILLGLFSENLKLVNLFMQQTAIDARIKYFIFEHLGKYYHKFLAETMEEQKRVEIKQVVAVTKKSLPVTTEYSHFFMEIRRLKFVLPKIFG